MGYGNIELHIQCVCEKCGQKFIIENPGSFVVGENGFYTLKVPPCGNCFNDFYLQNKVIAKAIEDSKKDKEG